MMQPIVGKKYWVIYAHEPVLATCCVSGKEYSIFQRTWWWFFKDTYYIHYSRVIAEA